MPKSLEPERGQTSQTVLIGTAGWSIPSVLAPEFSDSGTHLERYARRMRCVEINSSFYRPHRQATYAKWAGMVPEDFRFCVKVPKTVTHGASLVPAPGVLEEFLEQVDGLGSKLGALLVQLPPRRAFVPVKVLALLSRLRELRPAGTIVLEPRHASWFCDEADTLLRDLHIGRVAADPFIVHTAAVPGGDRSTRYYRLHGSPRVYYSNYAEEYLRQLAQVLAADAREAEVIVIFDNTAAGAALQNALAVHLLLNRPHAT